MSVLQLYVYPGAAGIDIASLDPESLIAASYLQLLRPAEWELVFCSEAGSSPDGQLPYLRDGVDLYSSSAILPYLQRTTRQDFLTPLQRAESTAFHAYITANLLPLTQHSLFSLPANWNYMRPLIASSLMYPAKLYRPEQLRQSAKATIDATHETWWGMGGEAEKEQEEERRRTRALLDHGSDGWKERQDEEMKQRKSNISKTFGKGKIEAAARKVFTALETTLAASSTPFFFGSSSPTTLDAHLSSLLSLLLFIPLPQPLLADQINASFPRLWAHTSLLRRTLWSTPPSSSTFSATSIIPYDLSLSNLISIIWSSEGTTKAKVVSKETKKEKEFKQKRLWFFGVVALGCLGWGLGTGAIPLPGRLGIWEGGKEEDGEWEMEEEYVR